MNPLRLIIDPVALPGARNMALDEALLVSGIENGQATLRWYRWAEPTLSLGYFQAGDPPPAATTSPTLARVKRLSGGGAILHHHEFTYSCVIPATHPVARSPQKLYELVHQGIIDALASRGVEVRMRGAGGSDPGQPFLCFGRHDPRDVVCGSDKVLGSAQRRRRGAVLQHGSLLLKRSSHAPDYPGLSDLWPDFQPGWDFTADLSSRIGNELKMPLEAAEPTPQELELAAQFEPNYVVELPGPPLRK